MSFSLTGTQNEETHIYYDRREWSVYGIFLSTAYIYVVGLVLLSELIPVGSWGWYFILVSPLILLADYGSLRITVTASKIRLLNGFFFSRRTISYDEIVDIVFHKNPTPKVNLDRTRPSSRKPNKFDARAKAVEKSLFIINLHDGDFCIIGSVHTQEVLGAIKKAQPHIEK